MLAAMFDAMRVSMGNMEFSKNKENYWDRVVMVIGEVFQV